MNKLSAEEFQDRVQAIARARKIFIKSGLTNNITEAFTLYQEVLAQEERQLSLRGDRNGTRVRTMMDGHVRPLCPYCGQDIVFKIINSEGKTNLLCSNDSCDHLWFSEELIPYWIHKVTSGEGAQVNLSLLKEGSKRAEARLKRRLQMRASRKGVKQFEPIESLCPTCGKKSLYKILACCGNPDGLIECGECEFTEQPKIFYQRSA